MTDHDMRLIGFGLIVLSGAVVMAAISGGALFGYLAGIVQALVAGAIVAAKFD